MFRALQKDLKSEKAESEAEVKTLDVAVTKLRTEIDNIRNSTATEIKTLEDATRTREDDDKVSWDKKSTSLSDRLEKLRAELAATSQRNRDQEEQLRKKKNKNQAEVETWIRNYDDDVRDKVGHIRAIQKEYAEEQKQLRWYEEYFQRVEAERTVRGNEQRKIDLEKAKENAQKALLDHAATQLQRVFRGRQVRKELAKAKGGKKGKKGKGAKGKKK
jgi:chromosome segregation ATPase